MKARQRVVIAIALATSVAMAAHPQPQKQEAPEPCDVRSEDASCGFSPATSIESALFHIESALGAYQARARGPSTIPVAIVDEATSGVNDLGALFERGVGPPPSAAWVSSLDFDARALSRGVAARDDAESRQALVAVNADLAVKLRSARATFGAQGHRPSEVEVVITTRRALVPVSGYRIGSSPQILPPGPPYFVFNNSTNPNTSRTLPPGLYNIFAYKKDNLVATQPAEISLEGGAKTLISVDVP